MFLRVVIFLSKIHPPHTQLVQPLLCTDAVILQNSLSCSCLFINRKWCLASFVSPSFSTVLTTCTVALNRWVYFSRIKQQLHSKKGVGLFSRVGLVRVITVLISELLPSGSCMYIAIIWMGFIFYSGRLKLSLDLSSVPFLFRVSQCFSPSYPSPLLIPFLPSPPHAAIALPSGTRKDKGNSKWIW